MLHRVKELKDQVMSEFERGNDEVVELSVEQTSHVAGCWGQIQPD